LTKCLSAKWFLTRRRGTTEMPGMSFSIFTFSFFKISLTQHFSTLLSQNRIKAGT
jgi:hypothetical protein